MISLFRKARQKPVSKEANSAAKPAASRPPTRAGTTSKPRRGKGVLAIIGGLLVASALTRVAIQATAAIALETGAPSEDAMASEHGASLSGDSIATCTAEEDIAPVLLALKAREERIAKRETAIETRMQALSIAEQEIDRKLVAMEEAELRLRSTLALAKTAADDDVDRLTQVYASMKPKQASALFEAMDPEFSAGFLARMRPDAAAAIMAGLTPATAYTISAMLAGRNASAPRQ